MNHSNVPPQYRRRKRNGMGCTCDCNYAKSLQGICKVLQLFILGLAWIVIAASPYYRPIFVIGGDTGPFHAVMLLSVVAWLATLAVYCMFMSGYHLSQGHRNWPKFEFWFNVSMAVLVLIAGCVEAANVWRWDMSGGNQLTAGGQGGAYSNMFQYGLRPGMSFTQTLNFNSYCSTRPYECQDYFNLLAGHNSYYTNHVFAVVLLFFALLVYLISTYFAMKTWRVFNRDMYKPGQMPKPTLWMRIQYRFETAANHVRDRANKALGRNGEEEEDAEADDVEEVKVELKKGVEVEAAYEKESSRSEGRRSRARSHNSHHGSHHGSRSHRSHRSHSEEGSSRHSGRHDDDKRSGRSSSTGRSKRSSHHGNHSSHHGNDSSTLPSEAHHYEDLKPVNAQPVGDLHTFDKKKKSSKKSKKEKDLEVDLSPVASVLI